MGQQPTYDPSRVVADGSVVNEWIDPRLPTIFTRWHDFHERCFSDVSSALIDEALIAPGDAVIDVGSGSGIPALAIAQTVGLTGSVVATDPSPVFITAIEHNARHLGLSNVRTCQVSATSLPERDGGFDAATCQMVAMFFPDLIAGLTCIRKVLRPGGRAAFAAWGPVEENALFTSFWGAMRSYLPPDPPPVGVPPKLADFPNPSRFAVSGTLSAALQRAGFRDVLETMFHPELIWPGPAETLCNFWQDMVDYEAYVPADCLAGARAHLFASINRYADGETIRLPSAIVMVSGQTSL